MRRLLAGPAILAALLLAPAAPAAAPTASAATASDVLVTEGGARLALISCAIRNTGTGWTVINDAGHTPSGCTGIVQRADHIELQHDVGAVRVSSLTVTVDETYAKADLRCGASVGFSLSRIYCHTGAAGSTPLDPATLTASTGNLWVYGLLRL
ncbi:hypothetical protein OG342_06830 [Streptomyces bobili]|uniref:hypothetical protein n=1 Tax=Streptomyces bobili TaxID=67280 RepID=UPI00224FF2EB|nr:hypothetical protein [Streptomyces bobili]MCX5522577.1 hypothetical protein [Streptomyces bobili]